MTDHVTVVRNNRPIGIVDVDYYPSMEELVMAKLLSTHTDGIHPTPKVYYKRSGRLGEAIKGFSGTASALPILKEVMQSSVDELNK
jgi:hypothetical protein